MQNFLNKISLLFITALAFGFLSLGATPAFAQIQPLQLNQTAVTLGVGERSTLQASNGTGLTVWSSSGAVKASMSGQRVISLVAVKVGLAKVTVCSQDVYCAMANVVVTKKPKVIPPPAKRVAPPQKLKRARQPNQANKVKASISAKVLALSQTKVEVPKQGTTDILVKSSSALTAVSDSVVVRTAVNNNRVTLYGTERGVANVKICDAQALCALARALVTPAVTGFTISQTNVIIKTGRTLWLSTANGSGLSVAVDHAWIVKAQVVDNLIMLTAGSSAGNATLKVCSVKDNCVFVSVTVKPAAVIQRAYGSFKSIALEVGESADVPFPSDFAKSYYLIPDISNPEAVASITINPNNFTFIGKALGAATFKLCPVSPDYSCGTIGVTVSASSYCGTNAGALQISESTITITRGQTTEITATNCNGLAAIPDSDGVVRTAVNGNQITLYATQVGQTAVQVCDASATCVPLLVSVVAAK